MLQVWTEVAGRFVNAIKHPDTSILCAKEECLLHLNACGAHEGTPCILCTMVYETSLARPSTSNSSLRVTSFEEVLLHIVTNYASR